MQSARRRRESGEWPNWIDASEVPFSEVMDPDAEARRLDGNGCRGLKRLARAR